MPFEALSAINDEEVNALFAYLATLSSKKRGEVAELRRPSSMIAGSRPASW